jgi:hypothetical protein
MEAVTRGPKGEKAPCKARAGNRTEDDDDEEISVI